MQKLFKLAGTALIAFAMAGGVAAATDNDVDCNIVNGNGANSVNTCTNNTDKTITYHCINDTEVVNINGQVAGSGTVEVSGNSKTGYVVSGNANNSNNVGTELNMSCVAKQASSTTTTKPEEKPTVKAEQTAKPAAEAESLPSTGVNPLVATGAAVLTLGVIAGLSRAGSKAYKAFRA